MQCSKKKRYNYKLLKRCVFRAFLKTLTDEDCLTVSGKSFQYFEADTVNVLSLAKVRVTEYVRRRGSLDDLKLLVGVYKFKQFQAARLSVITMFANESSTRLQRTI